MGNKQFKHIKPPTFNKDIWNEVTNQKRLPKQEHGMYRLLANNYTGEQIQQYNINFLNLAQFQKYIEFFQWRERQDHLVQAKFLNYEQTKQFCTTNYAAKAYIEHIPVRLSDIQDIPYPQNVYVMHSCLDGFEKLYLSVGYFRVLQDLICMDRDGKVKVWMNPNLSQCHTYQSTFSDQISGYRQSQKLQEKMVEQIIHMIQENTTQTKQYPTISQFIHESYKNKGLNFRSAKRQVYRYSQAYNIEVPNYFQSVIGVFDDQQSQDQERSLNNRLKSIPYFNNQNQDNNSSISEKYANHIHRSAERLSFKQSEPTFRKNEKDMAYPQNSKIFEKVPSYEQLNTANTGFNRPFSQLIASQHSQHSKLFMKPSTSTPPIYSSFQQQQSHFPHSTTIYRPLNANNSAVKIKFNYNSQSALNQKTASLPSNLPQSAMIKKTISSNAVCYPSSIDFYEKPLYKKDTAYSFDNRDRETTVDKNNWKKDFSVNDGSFMKSSSLNRLTYCDSQNSYELDSEIVEDMLKYLNF